ncbi:MAG: ArsR/SmtB family transcription factor [Archangium sp.]
MSAYSARLAARFTSSKEKAAVGSESGAVGLARENDEAGAVFDFTGRVDVRGCSNFAVTCPRANFVMLMRSFRRAPTCMDASVCLSILQSLTINKPILIPHDMQVNEDRIFRALADPSRRKIFESLSRGEAAVKDITARFEISQPAVSQHLAALSEAGLVSGRREGRSVYYRVEPKGMKPLIDWIAHYRAFWTEHIDRLEKLLENMDQ